MANQELQVAPRTVLGKKVKALRSAGQTPGNIFGHKVESTAVQVDTVALTHLLRHSSRNQIINLSVDGEPAPRTVVVRDVSRDPVTGKLLHVDFFQVSMTEKMRAQVPLVLVGESDAVKTYNGVLLQLVEHIEVEALPGDIPAHIEVDVSKITELEGSLHVRDLNIDTSRVTLHTDPDVVVARVASPRLATEEEAAAEAAAGAEAAAPAEGAPAEGSAEPAAGGD
jgi:large subunit ribosomal protein L25